MFGSHFWAERGLFSVSNDLSQTTWITYRSYSWQMAHENSKREVCFSLLLGMGIAEPLWYLSAASHVPPVQPYFALHRLFSGQPWKRLNFQKGSLHCS